jgi:hypothetical protein
MPIERYYTQEKLVQMAEKIEEETGYEAVVERTNIDSLKPSETKKYIKKNGEWKEYED